MNWLQWVLESQCEREEQMRMLEWIFGAVALVSPVLGILLVGLCV